MRIVYALVLIILSALIGSAVGELISVILPEGTAMASVFSVAAAPTWAVDNLDLTVLLLSFSFTLRLTLFTALGAAVGLVFGLRFVWEA